jgi:hypothetical protein
MYILILYLHKYNIIFVLINTNLYLYDSTKTVKLKSIHLHGNCKTEGRSDCKMIQFLYDLSCKFPHDHYL